MSPIPPLATESTLFASAPLTTPDPGSPGQPGSMASQYILGTGGFLFAVVAIVSVAGYFNHGRGSANAARKSNTWASLTGLLSSVRNIGSTTACTATTADWPVYAENGPDHINMVYAKFFHPSFWNLVECHAATAFAPAIFVEEEAIEVPKADPKPFGLNSFLDMDEDGEDKHRKGGTTPSREKSEKDSRARVEQVPPYDTSSSTNMNFVSDLIGTTVRPCGFLYVPGQGEDDPSESSDFDSELDFGSLAYDGIVTAPLTPCPSSRRHGMADMGQFVESLKGALAEESEGMVPTVSFRAGLTNILEILETELVLSCTPSHGPEILEDSTTSDNSVETRALAAVHHHDLKPRQNILSQQAMDHTLTDSTPCIASFDSCDNFSVTSSDVDSLVSHSSEDLMWKLYDDCLKAVGDTSENDISTSDASHGMQYGRSDVERIESCKPLRLRGTKDDSRMVSHYNASVRDSGYHMQSSLSERHVDIEQRNSNNNLGSYDSCHRFQGYSDDIESLEGPDELEDLMSEIYTKCLRSVDHESNVSDWNIAVHDSQSDMRHRSRLISPDTQGTAHQKGLSVVPSILSKYPEDDDSKTLDHFYEGYDSFQDSSTDFNTLERPEDLEDLLSQIHAEYLYWSKSVEADTVASNCVLDGCGDIQLGTSNTDVLGAPHEGPNLMRRILAELRDTSLDIGPRDISEDSGSEYSDDEEEEISRNSRRNSLESSYSSNCTPDSDVSDEGSIYPLTPPPMSAISVVDAPNVLNDRMSPPNTPGLHKEVEVISSLSMFSPHSSSREGYFLDPYLDCHPQSLSDNTNRERGDDTGHNKRRSSLDCTSSNTGTDRDVSVKGPIYPLTPLSMPILSAPHVQKGRMLPDISPGLGQEVQVISPFSCHSPPALPTKAYIPSHRDSRSSMYGPRLPLLDLPRI